MKNLLNKNIIITGGSSGIGLALAHKFASEGANLWLLARDESKLIAAREKIQSEYDGKIDYFVCDVTNLKELQKVYDYFELSKNNIDLIINSAGVVHPGEFINQDLEKFHWMMNINFSVLKVTLERILRLLMIP